MLDLLLRGGVLFDGSGAPRRRCDIGIADGRIAAIAPRLDLPARATRDVEGLWITPGFVDIHTHYDVELEIAPGLPESVRHGVTSVVIGNCSLSLTVGNAADLADVFLRVESMPAAMVRRWLAGAVTWETPAAYLAHLQTLALGPNVAALAGHSALRVAAMGLERALHATASAGERATMRRLAQASLRAGCIGLSLDLVHWHKVAGAYAGRSVPSHYADAAEVRMLAEVCRECDAVFQITPDPQRPWTFVQILALTIGLFRPPLRATVLSAMDMTDHPGAWRVFPLVTFLVNRVLGGNLRFQALPEPFDIYADGPITPFFEEFPSGVELNSAIDADARRALWADGGFRARFRADWTRRGLRTFHRDAARMTVLASPDDADVGLSIGAIARRRGADPTDTLIDLLATHDTALRWVACAANERPHVLERLLAHPHLLPGFSDAGAHSRNIAFFDSALSVLRRAATSDCLSMERAVARVSGEPARWFGIDAGEVRVGARADLVLLQPDALLAPRAAPVEVDDALLDGARRLVARGSAAIVAAVWIDGREVVRDGEPMQDLGQRRCGGLLTPRMPIEGRAAVQQRHRNRLDDQTFDHPFLTYWDVFVFKHQAPGNIALHCAAVALMIGTPLAALLTRNAWWLLGVPLSQITGLIGHALFERSHVDTRDLVFSWRASQSLGRMAVGVLNGRYAGEVRRVRDRYADWQATRT